MNSQVIDTPYPVLSTK